MRQIISFLMAALFFIPCFSAQAKDWYTGGTLHQATVGQFLDANYENALATAGDFVAAGISEQNVKRMNMDMVKEGSMAVLMCINETAKGDASIRSQKAAEIAFLCMTMLKKDFPWMLSKF